MNKSGQFLPFFFLMIGIIIFIIAIRLAAPLIHSSDSVRTQMDCSNDSISTDKKIACTTTDVVTPFIIAVIIGIGAIAFSVKVGG